MTTVQTEHPDDVRRTLARGRPADLVGLSAVALGRSWRSLTRHLVLVLYGLAGGVALTVWASFSAMVGKPVDAWCYYRIAPGAPYWQTDFAFFYPPAAAQAMIPFQALSFEAFVALIRAAELAAALALAGPFLPLVILWPPVHHRDQRRQRQPAHRRRGGLGPALAGPLVVRPVDQGHAGRRPASGSRCGESGGTWRSPSA